MAEQRPQQTKQNIVMKEMIQRLKMLTRKFPNFKSDDVMDIEQYKRMNLQQGQRISIVIDGPTLAMVLANEHYSNRFFRLGLLAASVVCCRVSPK